MRMPPLTTSPRVWSPIPPKKKAHKHVLTARARYDRHLGATHAAMLQAVSLPPGQSVLITNATTTL